MRHAAVASLVGGEIVKPLFKEALSIEIEARRADKHLRVARPAEALVSLRAVGRDIEEIALLTPDYIFEKLVHRLVRALEITRAADIRMDDDRREILFFHLIRPVLKADISKAEKGECAFIYVLLTVANELYLRVRRAVVGVVEVAVAVKRLAVGDCRLRTGSTFYPELDIARHILPEVNDRLACRGFYYLQSRHPLLLDYFFALLRDKHILFEIDADAVPRAPRFESRVIDIAVIYICISQLALARSPRAVGDDALRRAVGIDNSQLGDERSVAIAQKVAAVTFIGDGAPALTDRHLERILGLQHICHIVALHLKPV